MNIKSNLRESFLLVPAFLSTDIVKPGPELYTDITNVVRFVLNFSLVLGS